MEICTAKLQARRLGEISVSTSRLEHLNELANTPPHMSRMSASRGLGYTLVSLYRLDIVKRDGEP